MQWGIGIKIIRIQARISGRLRRHHGETTLVLGGQMETNSSSYSTQVQQKSSRTSLTAVRTDPSIILTGRGKTKKGQITEVIAIKGTSLIGTTGTRVIKGVLMCHHTRGTPPETIRISSIHTREIKGRGASSATIKEVKVIIAQIRGADRATIRGQVQINRTISLRGIWMIWYTT